MALSHTSHAPLSILRLWISPEQGFKLLWQETHIMSGNKIYQGPLSFLSYWLCRTVFQKLPVAYSEWADRRGLQNGCGHFCSSCSNDTCSYLLCSTFSFSALPLEVYKTLIFGQKNLSISKIKPGDWSLSFRDSECGHAPTLNKGKMITLSKWHRHIF